MKMDRNYGRCVGTKVPLGKRSCTCASEVILEQRKLYLYSRVSFARKSCMTLYGLKVSSQSPLQSACRA